MPWLRVRRIFSHWIELMNLVYYATLALALATLVHLKLEYDRENQPDTVYERRSRLNDAVLRLHTT